MLTQEQTQKAKTKKAFEPYVDCFGVLHVNPESKALDLTGDEYRMLNKVQPVLSGEGQTVPKIVGKLDIYEQTQSFKDDVGMAGMEKMINSGKAFAVDYMDDGKHGGDVSDLPDNVNDANTLAVQSKGVYNGGTSNEDFVNIVNDIVNKALAQKASAEKAPEGGEK